MTVLSAGIQIAQCVSMPVSGEMWLDILPMLPIPGFQNEKNPFRSVRVGWQWSYFLHGATSLVLAICEFLVR